MMLMEKMLNLLLLSYSHMSHIIQLVNPSLVKWATITYNDAYVNYWTQIILVNFLKFANENHYHL